MWMAVDHFWVMTKLSLCKETLEEKRKLKKQQNVITNRKLKTNNLEKKYLERKR